MMHCSTMMMRCIILNGSSFLWPWFCRDVYYDEHSPEIVKKLAVPALIVCVVMLALVPIIGVEVNGAKRWLGTQSVRFAPAEIAKPVVIDIFCYVAEFFGQTKFADNQRIYLYIGCYGHYSGFGCH